VNQEAVFLASCLGSGAAAKEGSVDGANQAVERDEEQWQPTAVRRGRREANGKSDFFSSSPRRQRCVLSNRRYFSSTTG
jgi:hypothetical protein